MRVELDQREVQVGVALGDATADEVADDLLGRDRPVDRLADHPPRRRLLGHGLVDLGRRLHHVLERRGLRVVDLHATRLRVHEHLHAAGLRRGPHRVEVARVVRLRRRRRQEDGARARSGDALDLGNCVVDVGEGHGRGGCELREVRREPLDDVIVVDARVRQRELVVVGVEPEQRQVRVQNLGVDAVEVHVLEDVLGISLGCPPPGLAVAGDRPALESRRVQAPEDPGAALDKRLDLEVLLPHRAVAEVLGQARDKQVRRLEEVAVAGDDEILRGHRCDSFVVRLNQPVGTCYAVDASGRVAAAVEAAAGRRRSHDEAVDATPARLELGRLW